MEKFNFNNFKSLFKVNILLNARSNNKNQGTSYVKSIIWYIFGGVFLAIIYLPLLLLSYNGPELSSTFDQFIIFLFVLGIVQSFSLFYNTLYDSRDLNSLLALPVSSLEIYLSKILTVATGSLVFVIPITVIIFVFNLLMGYPVFLNIIFTLYIFFFVSVFYIFINIILMELLSYSGLLYKFRSSLITILNLIAQIGAIAFVIFGQSRLNDEVDFENQGSVYGPISSLLKDWTEILPIVLVSLLVTIVCILVIKKLGDNYVSHYQNIQNKKSKNKSLDQGEVKGSYTNSLRISVYKYKLKYINNNTIISSSIFGILFMGIIPLINFLDFVEFTSTMLLAYSLYLSIISTVYGASLAGNIVSLDNNNFEMFKALPVKMSQYLTYNIELVSMLMHIVSIVIIIALGIVFKINFIIIVLALIINFALIYSLSTMKVYKDYKNIFIGWQSESELFEMLNKFTLVLQVFFLTLLFLIVSVIIEIASFTDNSGLVNTIIIVGSLLVSLIIYLIYSDKIAYTDND